MTHDLPLGFRPDEVCRLGTPSSIPEKRPRRPLSARKVIPHPPRAQVLDPNAHLHGSPLALEFPSPLCGIAATGAVTRPHSMRNLSRHPIRNRKRNHIPNPNPNPSLNTNPDPNPNLIQPYIPNPDADPIFLTLTLIGA